MLSFDGLYGVSFNGPCCVFSSNYSNVMSGDCSIIKLVTISGHTNINFSYFINSSNGVSFNSFNEEMPCIIGTIRRPISDNIISS